MSNKKHTIESVRRYFKDNNCELLEKEYKNNHYTMIYMCKCGNLSKISLSNFKKGKRCAKCGGTERHTFRYIKQFFKNKNLRTVKSNGITFCKNCHIQFHKKYGIKNNNKQQINEFLYIINLTGN